MIKIKEVRGEGGKLGNANNLPCRDELKSVVGPSLRKRAISSRSTRKKKKKKEKEKQEENLGARQRRRIKTVKRVGDNRGRPRPAEAESANYSLRNAQRYSRANVVSFVPRAARRGVTTPSRWLRNAWPWERLALARMQCARARARAYVAQDWRDYRYLVTLNNNKSEDASGSWIQPWLVIVQCKNIFFIELYEICMYARVRM